VRQLFIKLFSPLARFLGRVNPNALTITSLLLGILAGLSFVLTRKSPAYFLVGGGLTALSGMADSLDGIVARMYSRVTKTGDLLDHFTDRLVDVAILAGLTFSQGAHSIIGFTLIILALLHSYLGTQMEATLGERSYKGTGKAELFVAFVVFSILAFFLPDWALETKGLRFVPADLFMTILCAATLLSLFQRFRRGLQACREADRKQP
jgi:phosphatidylglycerophosphate synthase